MEKKTRKRAKKKIPSLNQSTRLRVFIRDKFTCYICKVRARELPHHPQMATVDHVLAVSKGGTNKMKNLRTCCYKCNTEKGDK